MRRPWVRILLTLAWLAAMPVFLNLLPSSTLPLGIKRDADGNYHVRAHPEIPLPAPLNDGDAIDVGAMSIDARAALFVVSNLPEGSTYDIVVLHEGQPVTVAVTSIPERTRLATVANAANIPIGLGFSALLLLTLWRGRDWSAWGLSLFATGVFLQNLFQNLPVPPLFGVAGVLLSIIVTDGMTLPGLFAAADSLAGTGLSARSRRRLRQLLIVLAVSGGSFAILRLLMVLFAGSTALNTYADWTRLPVVLMAGLPALTLALGYRSSSVERRLRIRWVLLSTGLLFALVAIQTQQAQTTVTNLILTSAMLIASIAGMLYAVLRHRLVDISFVLDRTLVYGLMTGLVVGVFALLEQIIEKLAVGNDASLLLQAGTTLIVALLLNRVHRRVESTVDQLLFKRQHRSIQQLHAFRRQCAHVERGEVLFPMAVERIASAVDDANVAIFLRTPDGYERTVQSDDADFPVKVPADDPALLAIRSTLQLAEFSNTGSTLGAEGWIFPMTVRGIVGGAVVAVLPKGVQLAPDQREALSELAHELGTAQYMIRAQAHERFIAALSTGDVASPVEQARKLLPSAGLRADIP